MKAVFWKRAVAVVAAGALATVGLVGCTSPTTSSSASSSAAASSSADSSSDGTVIKVGASPTPHAEILNQINDALAEEGYTLEIVEYNDYVLPTRRSRTTRSMRTTSSTSRI